MRPPKRFIREKKIMFLIDKYSQNIKIEGVNPEIR